MEEIKKEDEFQVGNEAISEQIFFIKKKKQIDECVCLFV